MCTQGLKRECKLARVHITHQHAHTQILPTAALPPSACLVTDTLCHGGHSEVLGRAGARVLHMKFSAEVVEGEEGVGEHQVLGAHGSGDEWGD